MEKKNFFLIFFDKTDINNSLELLLVKYYIYIHFFFSIYK